MEGKSRKPEQMYFRKSRKIYGEELVSDVSMGGFAKEITTNMAGVRTDGACQGIKCVSIKRGF